MQLNWTDIHDIAIELEEVRPNTDIINIRFTDLHNWILDLPNFVGKKDDCSEKILEAIQMAWLQERE